MPEPAGTIESILAWSKQLPLWQQDALRRLIVQRGLSSQDKAELKGMALKWAGLPVVGTGVEPCPLAAGHFPSEGTGGAVLKLLAIKELAGVNALAEGQTLSFGPIGLTVVYGANGAGKSGYFRVLKHGCQARALEPILGDVRQASPPQPKATFDVVGSVEGEAPRSINWEGGNPSPDLKQFSLFDSECGRQIIGTALDPVFLPVGLEAFSPFAMLLDEVRAILEDEVQKHRDIQHLAVCLSEMRGDHEVGRLLAAFPDRVTEAAIESLAAFSEAETEELRSIEARLKELEASDPATTIARLGSFKKRLDQERLRLAQFKGTFETESLRNLTGKWEARKVAQDARAQAQSLQSKKDPLPGVGSNPWHVLFQAAKAYSIQAAYPEQSFPVTDPGAHCVLCMQPLDPEAAERLKRFEAFVQDSTERLANQADSEWSAAFARLADAQLESTNSVLLEEVLREAPALHVELNEGCEELRQHHGRALESCRSGVHPGDLQVKTDILASLERLELSLDERIKSLSVGNPAAEASLLRVRQAALGARLSLGKHKFTLVEAVKRKTVADKLTSLLPCLATRAVTEKQKALAMDAIGGRYGEALTRELEVLEVNRFQLGYKSSATKGQVLQQLHFPDAPKVSKPDQVLSEGEHRVAALAAFLAETSLRPVASGIILDDPVSSLDHVWAERVAKRLVEEAKTRQVIVFTHHLYFLYALRDAAFEASPQVPFRSQTIGWRSRRPGVVEEGLPWICSGVRDRIGILDRVLTEASMHYEEDPSGEPYAHLRSRYIDLLRATWERLVEEDLFKGVVMRFKAEVPTRMLKEVLVEDEDYQAVFDGMSATSKRTDSHDHSINLMESEPSPIDLAAALAHLREYRKRLIDRQGVVRDRRKEWTGPR